MSNVIVVASGKGGVGKSTVSVCLGANLAKYNKKVLIVDCDSGMRGMDILLGVRERLLFDCADVICGNCTVKEATYQSKNFDNLYLLAAPFDVENEISPTVFRQLIDQIKLNYDYVILDSPAGLGSGFVTAATAADRSLIIVNAEPTSVSGGAKVKRKLESLGIRNNRLIINKFDKKQFLNLNLYEDLDEVIDKVGVQLIGLVPYEGKIVGTTQKGLVGRNWSPVMNIFDCIARRIMGNDVKLTFLSK